MSKGLKNIIAKKDTTITLQMQHLQLPYEHNIGSWFSYLLGRYFCVIHFCVIHPIFKEIDEVTQSVIQNFAVTYSVILAVIYSVILFFQWRKVSYSWKMPHQKKSIEIPQVAGVRNTGEFHRLGWCFIDWATAVVGRDDTGQLSVSLISSSEAQSKKHWHNIQNLPVQRDTKRWPGAKFHFCLKSI